MPVFPRGRMRDCQVLMRMTWSVEVLEPERDSARVSGEAGAVEPSVETCLQIVHAASQERMWGEGLSLVGCKGVH